MGTSGSTSGPGDKIPLLPDWAIPPGNPECQPNLIRINNPKLLLHHHRDGGNRQRDG